MRPIVRRLRDERGFSLVFSLLTVLVISVTLTSVVQFTTANSGSANRSEAEQIAYRLAETGINNAAAVLSNPDNNALQQSTLPSSEPADGDPSYTAKYAGGTSKWWGVLTGSQWVVHGLGIVTGPGGGTAVVRREVTSTIKIQPSLTQALNSNAWNYLFAKDTASACDVTFENSVTVDTSMIILGDVCFRNTAAIVKAAAPEVTNLYVGEHVHFGGTGTIGNASSPINEAHISGGCRVGGVSPGTSGETWTSPCSSATNVYAATITNNPLVTDGGPVADFDFWYANAKPGPKQFCTTSSNVSTTTFESAGSTTRDNSAAAFNLTPSSSYTCRYYDVAPNENDLLGELSWDNTTKVLSGRGVVYIDGSAYVSNNAVNTYQGLATLYLSGTFRIDGSAQLCGAVASGNCDFAGWDPNANNFGIVADGQDVLGYGVLVQNQARFQGSIYATHGVLLENQTAYDGPIVAGTFKFENNVVAREFPTITSVPVGWPGNPTVYAEPQPPQNYSG